MALSNVILYLPFLQQGITILLLSCIVPNNQKKPFNEHKNGNHFSIPLAIAIILQMYMLHVHNIVHSPKENTRPMFMHLIRFII